MRVDSALWHDAVRDAIADRFSTFVTLTGVDDDGPQVWLRLRNPEGEDRTLMTSAETIASITDLFPQSAWYERETAEMFGITFVGHDTQPLLLADDAPRAPLRKQFYLPARNETPWPGAKEPGEAAPSRRRMSPPGIRP